MVNISNYHQLIQDCKWQFLPAYLVTYNLESTLVQVMAWWIKQQAIYLSQCGPWSMMLYTITSPQCINGKHSYYRWWSLDGGYSQQRAVSWHWSRLPARHQRRGHAGSAGKLWVCHRILPWVFFRQQDVEYIYKPIWNTIGKTLVLRVAFSSENRRNYLRLS